MYVYIGNALKTKPLLDEAVKLLPEWVFDAWKIVPQFTVSNIDPDNLGDNEVKFEITYDNPNANGDQWTSDKHDAFDLALAFFNGYCLARGVNPWDGPEELPESFIKGTKP